MRNTTCYGRPHSPLLVHPPFPSFAWVMTTQTSSPTDAYTYGYAKNAHARARAQTQMQTYPQTRLPASCAARHGFHQPNPCSAKPLLPPELSPASAEASPATLHGTFMETVDYRYYDPPTRPYVPWRASLAPYDMQQLPPLTASPSRTKKTRLDSLLRALRRACGLFKGTRPSHAVA